MNDCERHVGRYAVLKGSDDGKRVVVICSFNSKSNNYKVRTIEGEEYTSILLTQLEFYAPNDFMTSYPQATTCIGSQPMSEVPAASVIDFTSVDAASSDATSQLQIRNSCRIIGDSVNRTTLSMSIDIETASDGNIVEFENMRIEPGTNTKQAIDCWRGNILFRSCTFNQNLYGVNVRKNREYAHVVFENCIFQGQPECSLVVFGGHASIVNCRFENVGMAVAVDPQASASVVCSTFEHCVGGVLVPRGGEAYLHQCSFEQSVDFAVLASNGSQVYMSGCSVQECVGDGIVVEGGEHTTATIEDTTIQKCRIGVRVGNGKVAVLLRNTSSAADCTLGVHVAADATGSVCVAECDLRSSNAAFDTAFVNLSGDKCDVTVDGEDIEPDTQIARLQQTAGMMASLGIKYGYPVSAASKRVLQLAGLLDIACAQCSAVAPVGSMFLKCARCREARYCSRACQVLHHPRHDVECRVLESRSTCLAEHGYVSCKGCGKVEALMRNEPLCACCRCLEVLYCNKQCQNSDWSDHKGKCKPYK